MVSESDEWNGPLATRPVRAGTGHAPWSGDLLKVDTVSRSHRARVNSVTIASPHRTIALRTKKAATTSAPKRRPAFRDIVIPYQTTNEHSTASSKQSFRILPFK